ncbi:MAG: hypothetical protein ACKOX0_05200 [Bacteroidota bacterium]
MPRGLIHVYSLRLLPTALLIGCGLALLAGCSRSTGDDASGSARNFAWADRERPLSYPGPLTEGDSLVDVKSLRVVANLAHGEFDSIRALANDSVFANVAETPYMSQLQGIAQLEAWHRELGGVAYQAFNVRGIFNQGSQSYVSYVFGRWQTDLWGDQYVVFALAWNAQRKLTGVVLWRTPWPIETVRPLEPSRTPNNFSFYSATRLGSDSAAQKAMDFTTAIYRNNLRVQQALLADTVEYHDGQGKFGYFDRATVLDLLDHRPKDHVHHVLRYTSVIPWTMLRFDREMAAVVTYEEWEDKATREVRVYSFCRLFFFDRHGKIDNFVFSRRLVHPVGRYPLVD